MIVEPCLFDSFSGLQAGDLVDPVAEVGDVGVDGGDVHADSTVAHAV